MVTEKLSFGKHQTFAFKATWIPKVLEFFDKDSDGVYYSKILSEYDAKYKLGLGTNMVGSLKYWLQVLNITKDNRSGGRLLTDFGAMLKEKDPYLENKSSLFLLHKYLVQSFDNATAWFYFFNEYRPKKFTREDFFKRLKTWLIKNYPNYNIADNTLIKDVNCFIQVYSNKDNKETPEDGTYCPLSELNFITPISEKEFKYNWLGVNDINPLLLLFVIIELLIENNSTYQNNEIEVTSLVNDNKNIGKLFHLTSFEIIPLLSELVKEYSDLGVKFIKTAGLNYLKLNNNLSELRLMVLGKIYE